MQKFFLISLLVVAIIHIKIQQIKNVNLLIQKFLCLHFFVSKLILQNFCNFIWRMEFKYVNDQHYSEIYRSSRQNSEMTITENNENNPVHQNLNREFEEVDMDVVGNLDNLKSRDLTNLFSNVDNEVNSMNQNENEDVLPPLNYFDDNDRIDFSVITSTITKFQEELNITALKDLITKTQASQIQKTVNLIKENKRKAQQLAASLKSLTTQYLYEFKTATNRSSKYEEKYLVKRKNSENLLMNF
jgi:hypothetical protein